MSGAEEALAELAGELRADDTLLRERVRSDITGSPVFGPLAASGPRAQGAEADYAFVVEAVREGYLLHYAEPRVLGGLDPDLALLAGDHLYALGLERLAGLGDLEAVRELADLISLSAVLHADGPAERTPADALWLAAGAAVAGGSSDAHEAAKSALRAGGAGEEVARALAAAGAEIALAGGFESAWAQAADSIDFDLPDAPASG